MNKIIQEFWKKLSYAHKHIILLLATVSVCSFVCWYLVFPFLTLQIEDKQLIAGIANGCAVIFVNFAFIKFFKGK